MTPAHKSGFAKARALADEKRAEIERELRIRKERRVRLLSQQQPSSLRDALVHELEGEIEGLIEVISRWVLPPERG